MLVELPNGEFVKPETVTAISIEAASPSKIIAGIECGAPDRIIIFLDTGPQRILIIESSSEAARKMAGIVGKRINTALEAKSKPEYKPISYSELQGAALDFVSFIRDQFGQKLPFSDETFRRLELALTEYWKEQP